MIRVNLKKLEKQRLESQHKMSHSKKLSDRIKAILLSDEGWSSTQISQALRKHESSIVRWLNAYIEDKTLTSSSGGSEGYLNDDETEQLIAHLEQVTYLQTHQIVTYVEKTYGVKYAVSGLNKWLHQHRFSYKQPKGIPHKFDSEKQAEFIEHYKELKASLSEDEPLLFMDAVHPTQATKITSGWIRTGVDKCIETTGSRTRLNVVGAIRLGHLDEAVVERYEKVNGETIVEFLKTTRANYRSAKTIHLVLDGAGYHRSKLVVEQAEKLKITLHYLPPYSPNLNPIERLWKVMNKSARNSQYFATTKEFREQIDRFFKVTLPDIAASLDITINDNFQKLNHAF